jgi:hypothetical protein
VATLYSLAIPRPLSSEDVFPSDTVQADVNCPACDRIHTHAGCAFNEAICLCDACDLARAQQKRLAGSGGGVISVTTQENGGVVEDSRVDVLIDSNGGADAMVALQGSVDDAVILSGVTEFSYSSDVLADFVSFLAPLSFPDGPDISVNDEVEADILWHHWFSSPLPVSLFLDGDLSLAFKVYNGPRKHLDLMKEPLSYAEAMARSDADAWRTAMEREKKSLEDMGAFEEVDLPSGERMIGLKWVYAYKTNVEGMNILE